MVAHELQITSIREEAIQLFRKIAMLYSEYDIKVQMH